MIRQGRFIDRFSSAKHAALQFDDHSLNALCDYDSKKGHHGAGVYSARAGVGPVARNDPNETLIKETSVDEL
jgi:hypothetical protein